MYVGRRNFELFRNTSVTGGLVSNSSNKQQSREGYVITHHQKLLWVSRFLWNDTIIYQPMTLHPPWNLSVTCWDHRHHNDPKGPRPAAMPMGSDIFHVIGNSPGSNFCAKIQGKVEIESGNQLKVLGSQDKKTLPSLPTIWVCVCALPHLRFLASRVTHNCVEQTFSMVSSWQPSWTFLAGSPWLKSRNENPVKSVGQGFNLPPPPKKKLHFIQNP